jgi:pimeloyl-ACP methyl ester carboxylesterase
MLAVRMLVRRAFLGLVLDGNCVHDVIAGSMADAADLRKGDVLLSIDGQGHDTLDRTLRVIARKARVVMMIARGEERLALEVDVVPRPEEILEGHGVTYGDVEVDGVRQRTIITRPHGEGRFPAIVLLQGIGEDSIESSLTPLVEGFAGGGFATLRVERRGIGDSEGDASERDPLLEIAAYTKAIARLREEPWVGRIGLFGHSLGGMLAPFLASRANAIVVYGTSAERWLDCVEASTRRQLALRGARAEAIDERAIAERRSATPYDHALHRLDVARAWRSVACPTLVLHGEHDWVASEEEARAIVSLVPAPARFEVISGADHAFTLHATEAESLARYGQGTFAKAIVDIASAFLRS